MPASPVTVGDAKCRLRLFNDKARRIINGRFKEMVFREDHGFTLNFTPEGTQSEKRGADEDATLAVAVTLRFFVQPRDKITFGQIAELYELLPVSDKDKRNVRQSAASVGAFLNSTPTGIALKIGNEKITIRRLFDIYMYGSLVHANPEKAAFFEKWISTSPYRVATDVIFEQIVTELIRAAHWFHGVNERALASLSMNDSLELTSSTPTVATEPVLLGVES